MTWSNTSSSCFNRASFSFLGDSNDIEKPRPMVNHVRDQFLVEIDPRVWGTPLRSLQNWEYFS